MRGSELLPTGNYINFRHFRERKGGKKIYSLFFFFSSRVKYAAEELASSVAEPITIAPAIRLAETKDAEIRVRVANFLAEQTRYVRFPTIELFAFVRTDSGESRRVPANLTNAIKTKIAKQINFAASTKLAKTLAWNRGLAESILSAEWSAGGNSVPVHRDWWEIRK